jgi:hypothetical protein
MTFRPRLATLRQCLQLRASVTLGGKGSRCYRIQWGDRRFREWLIGIGLSPAKSLILGPLLIPDVYFPDFFRGCIDGDGSIVVYTDRYHVHKNERYVYKRLYATLVSASRPCRVLLERGGRLNNSLTTRNRGDPPDNPGNGYNA